MKNRTIRKNAARLAVLLAASLGFTAWAQTPLKVHGAVVLKGILDPHVAELATRTGVKLELAGNGADNGLLDLVEGRADVAMLSASLEDVAAKVNAKKP
ncbi:MAG TPA: hypothetical protein VK327_15955, partial [Candidatus Paceibacterota bacterium]|nr:hypothetical protein [Candidatus Paceibacterota bacterium]